METPKFVEAIVNAIGDISITEALNAIDREYRQLGPPASGLDVTPHAGPPHYTSTACHHGRHRECRRICKFCNALCKCVCHIKVG